MTARETYEMQGRLRDAEDRLRERVQDEQRQVEAGAFLAAGQWMNSPEAREVETLRAQVEAAQAEVGGVVYRIPGVNVGELSAKLDKLVKRANKLGLGEVTYKVDPEVEHVEQSVAFDPLVAMAEQGYIPRFPKSYRYVILDAGVVKLAGWMLLATLTVESGGVMTSKVPPFARAWAVARETGSEAPNSAYRREADDPAIQQAQAALDAINLGVYADEQRATLCQHCGLARRRTATFLVEHVETGEIKQVGRNCLRDFLGVDPHTLVKYAQYLSEIEVAMDDDEMERGVGGRRLVETEEYVTHVCTMLRTKGWIGASEEYKGTPTKAAALDNIFNYGKTDKGYPLFEEITEADHERAKAAIEWAKDHLGAKVHQSQDASDFERNMYVAANGDVIPSKSLGVLAYVPVAHARFQEREIERAERAKQTADSKHVGEVGQRLELRLTVTNIFEQPGDWGSSYMTVLNDETGNVFKWYASTELERGKTYTGKWTVKGHGDYKGTLQTQLTRGTGVVEYDPDAPPPPVKPTKLGQREDVVYNGETIGQVEKIKYGFRCFIDGEAVVEDAKYRRACDLLFDEHNNRKRDRERREYLSAGLVDGLGVKMGSFNPHTTYRAYSHARFVKPGEQVALLPQGNGDRPFIGSETKYRPARPPKDNERAAEFIWAEAQVEVKESGFAAARAVDPDGHVVPLGEMEVIVR